MCLGCCGVYEEEAVDSSHSRNDLKSNIADNIKKMDNFTNLKNLLEDFEDLKKANIKLQEMLVE